MKLNYDLNLGEKHVGVPYSLPEMNSVTGNREFLSSTYRNIDKSEHIYKLWETKVWNTTGDHDIGWDNLTLKWNH